VLFSVSVCANLIDSPMTLESPCHPSNPKRTAIRSTSAPTRC
jgi:hypothetical protein